MLYPALVMCSCTYFCSSFPSSPIRAAIFLTIVRKSSVVSGSFLAIVFPFPVWFGCIMPFFTVGTFVDSHRLPARQIHRYFTHGCQCCKPSRELFLIAGHDYPGVPRDRLCETLVADRRVALADLSDSICTRFPTFWPRVVRRTMRPETPMPRHQGIALLSGNRERFRHR